MPEEDIEHILSETRNWWRCRDNPKYKKNENAQNLLLLYNFNLL